MNGIIQRTASVFRNCRRIPAHYMKIALGCISISSNYINILRHDVLLSRTSIADRLLDVMIGRMVRAWAHVEALLDYSILVIVTHEKMDSKKLPMPLNAKLDLFRRLLTTIDALTPIKAQSLKLADDIDAIKDVRHDIIHGLIRKTIDNEFMKRNITRHSYGPGSISEATKSFDFTDIIKAHGQMLDIGDTLLDLHGKLEVLFKGLGTGQAAKCANDYAT
jgi:hypothetical protein